LKIGDISFFIAAIEIKSKAHLAKDLNLADWLNLLPMILLN
jgi:hypothetical protein